MHRRLVIDVNELTFERLAEVAEQQRRDPKSQAVVLLERALRRVVLPDQRRDLPPLLGRRGGNRPVHQVAEVGA